MKPVQKIYGWIKENRFLFYILVFAFAIRIFYFFITKNQPVWYDEADYLNIAKSWAGIYYWPAGPLRPILFPIIFRLLLLVGLGENTMRILILLSSLASVLLIYKISNLFFNKRIALHSAFFLAVLWSFVFYTNRLLVDVPVAFLWLLTTYFFFEAYFKNKNWKHFILPGVFLGLAFLMKNSSAVLVILLAIYLLFTERMRIFKNVKIYSFYLASFLTVLPYLVWQKIKFGSFFAFYTAARGGDGVGKAHTFWESLSTQTLFSLKVLDPLLLKQPPVLIPIIFVLILVGFVLLIFPVSLLPEGISKKASPQNKSFFLILWAILGLLFFGWLNYGDYMDERYYFIFYPVLLIFMAYAMDKIYLILRTKGRYLGMIFIILVLAFGAYTHLGHADNIIKAKATSFIEIRQAGEFVNQVAPEGRNILVAEEGVELLYYTERPANLDGTIENRTDLLNKIETLTPSHLVLPMYYYLGLHNSVGHQEVVYSVFTDRERFTPIKTFGPAIDQNRQIPSVTIFEINY